MRKLTLMLWLGLVLLAGCDAADTDTEAKLKARTMKDFSANWSMMTVEHDGHKFIVGTYAAYRTYSGAMLHHPDCACKVGK